MQAKGVQNLFIKIITENFSNLEKTMPIHVQESFRTPNRLDQKELPPNILSLKQQGQRIEKEY
jgi:hypothetical protein